MKRSGFYIICSLLFIPPLVFFTDLTRNPYFFQIVLLNSLTVLLWILWLYKSLKENTISFFKTSLDYPLFAFFFIATVSWLWVLFKNFHEPYLSYGIFNEGLKRWLFLIVNSICVYYISVNFIDDNNRPKFMVLLFWTGLIASIYGIFQYFSIEFFWPHVLNPFGGRSVSTFGNPNFFSSYLILLMPLIYIHYIQATSFFKRIFYFLSFIIYFAALLCTLTRSSWLGLFLGMSIVLFFIYKYESGLMKKWKKLVVVPFMVMLLFILFWPRSNIQGYNPSVISRLTESADAGKTYYAPWHQRRLIWSCAWYMIIENPFLGKGWGCFELFYPSYQGRHLFLEAYHNFRTHANNCHNEILEIWSQTGTVGFGIYLWLICTIIANALFLIKNLKGEKKLIAISLFAGIAGMWADNLLNVSMHFAVPAFLYWWNIGMLINLGKNERKVINVKSKFKKILILMLIIAGCILIKRYYDLFKAEIHYFKGFKLSKRNAILQAIPELEKAHSLQRLEVNNNYELANCYARSGSRDKGIWGYKEALRANAGYDEIYFNMATVLNQLGNNDEAIEEYTRTLYINPLSLDSYVAMGTIFLQNPEKYAKAGIELYKQCLHLFPNNKDIWNNLGYLYTKTGNYNEALNAYLKAVSIDPDFELGKKNLKITLKHLGKIDKVFEERESLISKVEQDINTQNWQMAIIDCQKLVKMSPSSFKARLYMANIYFTVKRISDAIIEYKEAQKLDNSNLSVINNLGLAYFENKQYDLSRNELQKVVQVDPNNHVIKQKLLEIERILEVK